MRHAKPALPAKPAPPADMLRTARSIAAAQRPDGAIPWPDEHVDPWDHVECAMALSACGLVVPARLAYRWLRDTQRPDGSWPRTTGGSAGCLMVASEASLGVITASMDLSLPVSNDDLIW